MRKATPAGAERFAGNGEDTNVNGNDFVLQTNGRDPQNTASAPEPPFASGGNGTGRGRATPTPVYAGYNVPTLTISVAQDVLALAPLRLRACECG